MPLMFEVENIFGKNLKFYYSKQKIRFIISIINLQKNFAMQLHLDQSLLSSEDTNLSYNNRFFSESKKFAAKYQSKPLKNVPSPFPALLTYQDNQQLIIPITHWVFDQKKKGSRKLSFNVDEEQQESLKAHLSSDSPIHSSKLNQPKSKNKVKNRIRKNTQQSRETQIGQKLKLNPEYESRNITAHIRNRKIHEIVNRNLKHIDDERNVLLEERQRFRKFGEEKVNGQQKPITKKSFKISNVNIRLSESKMAVKQQILLDSQKMMQKRGDSQIGSEIEIKKSFVPSRNEQPIIQVCSQIPPNVYSVQQCQKEPQKELLSQNQLRIDFQTKTTDIKRALIQSSEFLQVIFSFPQMLYSNLPPGTTTSEIKQKIISIFGEIGLEHQIVSIKSYQDQVFVKNKNLCIIWNRNNSGYFGQFKTQQTLALVNKHGVGFQWKKVNGQYELYYGQFYDNRRDGYGIWKTKDQTYIGCWKEDIREGWGKVYIEKVLKEKREFKQKD